MKMKNILMVGLLSMSMLTVGCQSTVDTEETDWKPKVTEEEYLKIAEEIESNVPNKENMYIELYEGNLGYNTYFLTVTYAYEPLGNKLLDKQERKKVVNEMREYHKEVNEKYGQNDYYLSIAVEIIDKKNEESNYLITNENEYDESFLK